MHVNQLLTQHAVFRNILCHQTCIYDIPEDEQIGTRRRMRIKILIQGSIVDFSIVGMWFLCLRGDSSIYMLIFLSARQCSQNSLSCQRACHDELLQKPSWNDYENATHIDIHQLKVNYVTSMFIVFFLSPSSNIVNVGLFVPTFRIQFPFDIFFLYVSLQYHGPLSLVRYHTILGQCTHVLVISAPRSSNTV